MSDQLTTARPVAATGEPVAENQTSGRDLAGPVCIVLAVVAVLMLVGSFIWSASRGFDLTDEGNLLRLVEGDPTVGTLVS